MFKWNPFTLEGETPGALRYISFGKEKAKQEPVKEKMWNPEQEALFSALQPILKAGLTEEVPRYPGQMYVSKTPEEAAYLANTANWTNQLAALRANIAQPAYSIAPETTEQYYRDVIRAPAIKEWEDIVEPQIRESFVGPGYWSGARAQAQANGAESLATSLAAQRANLYYQDELAERQALEAAKRREAEVGPATIIGEANMMGSAGAYARMIDQEAVAADLQRWLMGEEANGVTPGQYNPFIQLVFQALGLSPYALGTKGESSGFNFSVESPFKLI